MTFPFYGIISFIFHPQFSILQYAPFKKGGKGTLAERARCLGLDIPAQKILTSPNNLISLSKYIKTSKEGKLKL